MAKVESDAALQRDEPMVASPVTVPVERRGLTSEIVVRGDLAFENARTLSLAGGFGPTIQSPVVTWIPAVGTMLDEGDVALEIAGRPVFVLRGDVPMYRDLRADAIGVDVGQLNGALARIGHLEVAQGADDERWTGTTAEAVEHWYESAGYFPTGPSEDDRRSHRAAQARLRDAQDRYDSAQRSLSEAQAGPEQSQILAHEAAVRAAQDELSRTQTEAEDSARDWERAVEAAREKVELANEAGALAEQRLQAGQNGQHPDHGEPPTSGELEELESEAEASAQEAATALEELEDVEREAERAAQEHTIRIRRAQDSLAIASAALEELMAPPETAELRRQLTSAASELDQAISELREIESYLGPWIPAGELIFVSDLPVRVDTILVELGMNASAEVLRVATAEMAITTTLPPIEAALVSEGAEVTLTHPTAEQPLPGRVGRLGDGPGTDGAPPGEVYVEIVSDEFIEKQVGTNWRIAIPLGSTEGEVLAVPAAAIWATSDGSSLVRVQDQDGSTRDVTVLPGLSAEGLVEVRPVEGDLDEGDQVVVGHRYQE